MFTKICKWLAIVCIINMFSTVSESCKIAAATGNNDYIKVGCNLELTGAIAPFANEVYNGVKLAIKEVNEHGGIDGRKIVLVTADNKSMPAEAAVVTAKLIDQDNVCVVIGPSINASLRTSTPVATERRIPLIAPTGLNPFLTFKEGKVQEYLFRGCLSDPVQGRIMARFAIDNLKMKKVAIYVDKDSMFDKNLAEAFSATIENAGGQVVAAKAYLHNQTDFKNTLLEIKESKADVIFIPGYYNKTGLIVKQAREVGIDIPLLGSDGWDAPEMVELAGAAALDNTFFSSQYSAQDNNPYVQKFIRAYQKEYTSTPSTFGALGYDTGKIVIDALKRTGGNDPQKIKDAMALTKNLPVATGKLTMDYKHDPIKSAVVIAFQEGRQVFKTRFEEVF